jgi:hypothetical protein
MTTDAHRAAHELAAVPNLGMSAMSLHLVTGWPLERCQQALQELIDEGVAVGIPGRRVRLTNPPERPRNERGPQTDLRWLKGSCAIAAGGYDPQTGTLELVFRTNTRTIYRYHDVADCDGRAMADSLNHANRMDVFLAQIKGRYSFTRVGV